MVLAAAKIVLMVIAWRDFRDEEYRIPRQILEKAGYQVEVVSTQTGMATGMLGLKVGVEKNLNDVKSQNFDGLILVGGSGTTSLYENERLHLLVQEFVRQKKPVGAICLAPVILAKAGVLQGKKATVYVSAAEVLRQSGVIYSAEEVVTDGLIVTANGPSAAKNFATAFLHLLQRTGLDK